MYLPVTYVADLKDPDSLTVADQRSTPPMSTPETNFEKAVDGSSDDETRTQAIEDLEAANECDMLANLVENDDLEDEYREQALTSLAHPQCKPMLETLVESGDLPESYQERAEQLLQETPEDAGAGP